jgi:uncharacterized protein (TIGR02246 family)
MKKLLKASVIMLMGVSLCRTQDQPKSSDERQVQQVIDKLDESFKKRDADMRAALFTPDGSFINAFGQERHGRDAIREFWKTLFATGTFDNTNVQVTRTNIKFIRTGVAVVDRFENAVGQRGIETKAALPERRIHLTFILTKENGQWLLAYYSAADLRSLETLK